MSEYRLYIVDGDGSFAKAHEISAPGDTEALEHVQGMNLTTKAELWQRGRLVAKIEPGGEA